MCSAVCICVREALIIFFRNESVCFCALSLCLCLHIHSVSGKQAGSKTLRGTCALRLSLSCQTSQTDFPDVNIVHAKDVLQFHIVHLLSAHP